MWSRALRCSAVVLFLALASRGRAATYCVDLSGSGCDVTSSGSAGLTSALTAAAASADDDIINIGAGTYLGPFAYLPTGNSGTLTIVGSGSDQTTLSDPVPGSFFSVISLGRDMLGKPANVSKIAVVIPSTAVVGIFTDGLVEDVRVTSLPPNGGVIGVELLGTGSGIRHCQIEMNNVTQGMNQAIGVETNTSGTISPDPSPAFIEDSSVFDGVTTVEALVPLRITRCRVSANGNGSFAIDALGTNVTVEDSLVVVSGRGDAVRAMSEGTHAGSLLVRQVTAVSVGATSAFAGISVDAESGNASADVRHSIIRGFENSTVRSANAGLAATVSFSACDYPFDAHLVQGAGDTTLTEPEPNIDADPLFVDALAGNYELSDGSPAIDASYSPPLAPDESPTDLLGAPRIQDGNGDGIAARDMGAFEHPAVAKPPTTTTTVLTTTTTAASATTTTTLPCTTPRCLFDAALRGRACAGATVPQAVTAKIAAAEGLLDRVASSSGKKERRVLGHTRRVLGAITRAAAHASKGKKARIPAGCSMAIAGAARAVRAALPASP